MAKLKAPTEQPANTPAVPSVAGFTPRFAESEKVHYPRLSTRPPVLLMAHPERWTVLDGVVVPQLGKFPLQAGIGRVTQLRDGRYSMLEGKAALESQGWTIIPVDVDGPGTSYLREVAPGVYVTAWEQTFAGSAHIEPDLAGYVAWLSGLMERGVLAPPAPYVLELLHAKKQREHDDLADRVQSVPSLRAAVNRLAADLAAIAATQARYGRGSAVTAKAVDMSAMMGE